MDRLDDLRHRCARYGYATNQSGLKRKIAHLVPKSTVIIFVENRSGKANPLRQRWCIAEMTRDGFFEPLTPDSNLPIALGKGGCFARLCVQKKNRRWKQL